MPDEGELSAERPQKPLRLLPRFLLVRLTSSMAWQMQAVAVGWYVYALTGSAFDLGLIGLVQFVPFAGLALVAGHLVDRYQRRTIVSIALSLEILLSLALTGLALSGTGNTVWVFVVIAGYGACRAFEQPAMQSWLPGLVPAADFPRSAARLSFTSQTAVILGPALGGFIYILGPAVPFAVVAALQVGALVAVRALPAPRRIVDDEELSWDTLLGGVRFIRREPMILGSITLDLFCVLFGGVTALLPIFARDILAVGPAGLGLLRSAPAVGALATGLVLSLRPPDRRAGPRMMIAVAIYGAATLVFGLSHNLFLSLAALATLGAADMLSVVIRSTLVQVVAPDAIRGRVTSVASLFTGASNQLGQFESGVTAAWFGPVGSVVLGGLATLAIVALWTKQFPALLRLDRLAISEAAVDIARESVPESSYPL
jgi:MFS family permease